MQLSICPFSKSTYFVSHIGHTNGKNANKYIYLPIMSILANEVKIRLLKIPITKRLCQDIF